VTKINFYDEDYEAVVFDMDGVIFDSERAVMLCWIELANKYGIEDIEEPYLACTGTNLARTKEIMLEAYGDDFPYDMYAKEASIMYHEKYDGGNLPMKPGVAELLEYLKHEKKKIALASSTRRQTVVNQLEWAGIKDYFDVIICGDMVKKSKPAPDIFLKACEELKVAPEKAYAIEDSYNGIRAAYAGKLRPIMVPDLLPPNEEMNSMAEVVLSDLGKVKTYLCGGTL
jgi:HAD superfamily hydrolase (TIGR01509 family)